MKPSNKGSKKLLLMCIIFVISTVGCGKKEEIGVGKTETISTEETANVSLLEDSDNGDKELSTSNNDFSSGSETISNSEPGTKEDVEQLNTTSTEELLQKTSDDNLADSQENDFVAGNQERATSVENVSAVTEDSYNEEESQEENGLSLTQRNSINMLNYMTVLTQKINESKGNQLFLESAYSSLVNDIYPNAVDTRTQAQIASLMDTVDSYRMIAVKRDRLEYIYEQNRAQAMRQAIPNPVGLLSAVQSENKLEIAASVLYMAVDSVSSYSAAASQADLQFIKEGWELDDAESAELHNSTKNALTYMLNMVRDYDLPGDYALSAESVQDFVTWSSKPDSQLVGKIAWFESHKSTYQEFGPYWLEVAKDYYNSNDYEKCLDAIHQYESVSTRIFRKDIDYATALPMAIVSAKEIMEQSAYIKMAEKYCDIILANIKDSDWSLRYYAAQVFLDLYSLTKETSYLDQAYKAAFDNVVVLVEEQRSQNSTYLSDISEIKAESDATKREKKEIKEYNKSVKEERKIALPPVNEALYLNCDLLFSLADEMNISEDKRNQINSILHENNNNIFLTQILDDRFWFGKKAEIINADEIKTSFDGKKITIPASYVTDRSIINVTVRGENGSTTIEDWSVTNVKRPKGAGCSEFIVYYESEAGSDYKYQDGDTVSVKVIPIAELSDKSIEIIYNVKKVKFAFVFKCIEFERVTK